MKLLQEQADNTIRGFQSKLEAKNEQLRQHQQKEMQSVKLSKTEIKHLKTVNETLTKENAAECLRISEEWRQKYDTLLANTQEKHANLRNQLHQNGFTMRDQKRTIELLEQKLSSKESAIQELQG